MAGGDPFDMIAAVMSERRAQDWRQRAACVGLTSLPWFDVADPEDKDHLRAICDACPVISECRAYALDHGVHGYWAGTSERQRARMRRERRLAG